MSWNRLAFDISIPSEKEQADLDLTMEEVRRRGAEVRYAHNLWNLFIPRDLDVEPFKKTLENCSAVSWIASHAERHIIIRDDDDY